MLLCWFWILPNKLTDVEARFILISMLLFWFFTYVNVIICLFFFFNESHANRAEWNKSSCLVFWVNNAFSFNITTRSHLVWFVFQNVFVTVMVQTQDFWTPVITRQDSVDAFLTWLVHSVTSALTASGIWPAVWVVKNATAVVKARPRPLVVR